MSARLLKDAVDVVAPTWTSLFNFSIESRSFSSFWKLTKVTPLYKKGNKQNPSNNRLCISNCMPTYVNHLLSNKQFGFLLKASTFTATAQFTDQILTAVDNGMVTCVVSIDLTKAFDMVNHSMLLSIRNI